MENINKEELFKQMFSDAPAELSVEDLEGVAGGVITPEGEAKLRWGLGIAKSQGLTMKEVIDLVPTYYNIFHSQFPDTTAEEAIDLIEKIWDTI